MLMRRLCNCGAVYSTPPNLLQALVGALVQVAAQQSHSMHAPDQHPPQPSVPPLPCALQGPSLPPTQLPPRVPLPPQQPPLQPAAPLAVPQGAPPPRRATHRQLPARRVPVRRSTTRLRGARCPRSIRHPVTPRSARRPSTASRPHCHPQWRRCNRRPQPRRWARSGPRCTARQLLPARCTRHHTATRHSTTRLRGARCNAARPRTGVPPATARHTLGALAAGRAPLRVAALLLRVARLGCTTTLQSSAARCQTSRCHPAAPSTSAGAARRACVVRLPCADSPSGRARAHTRQPSRPVRTTPTRYWFGVV